MRVPQRTTGKTRCAAGRGAVASPILELICSYVWAADKLGWEVGELRGIDPIGITATNDIDALIAIDPNCVVYKAKPMPSCRNGHLTRDRRGWFNLQQRPA